MPCSLRPPRTRKGGRPSCVSISAPIFASGSVMRRIGRLDRDSSPTNVLSNACPANKPASSRMPVPALPQSSGLSDARKPCKPTPWTMRSPEEGASIRTPSCASTAAVARVSSPSRKPRMCDVPSAIAESIIDRCDTDLSPGTTTSPCKAVAGWLIQSRRCAPLMAGPPGRRPTHALGPHAAPCPSGRPAAARHRYDPTRR
jgi:hypothetical protein